MATPDLPGNVRDDRVSALTRWVSLVIILFLVVAFVVLVPWPSDTARLFAWDIKPVLGSVYLGGAYFFLRAFRAKEWHTVKGGFVAVLAAVIVLYLRMETRLAQPAAEAS